MLACRAWKCGVRHPRKRPRVRAPKIRTLLLILWFELRMPLITCKCVFHGQHWSVMLESRQQLEGKLTYSYILVCLRRHAHIYQHRKKIIPTNKNNNKPLVTVKSISYKRDFVSLNKSFVFLGKKNLSCKIAISFSARIFNFFTHIVLYSIDIYC